MFPTFLSFLLRYEGGISVEQFSSLPAAFQAMREATFVNDPDDRGGATLCGITLPTYRLYLRQYYGREDAGQATADELRHLDYFDWQNIVRRQYWAPLHCDEMQWPGVALCLADFGFNSGVTRAVRALQSALNEVAVSAGQRNYTLAVDGIYGPATAQCVKRLLTTRIRALEVCRLVTKARLALIEGGVASGRIHAKFRTGLIRRAEHILLRASGF